MKMIPITILCLILICGFVTAKNIKQINYQLNSKEIIYDDNSHKLILGGEIYTDSNGTRIEDTSSLLDCEYCNQISYMEYDNLFPITVHNINYSHINFTVFVTDYYKNQWIPITIYNRSDDSQIIYTDSIKLRNSYDGKTYLLPLGFQYKIKWGLNSTRLILQFNYSLAATYTNSKSGASNYVHNVFYMSDNDVVYGYRHTYLSLNTTSIPSNAIIQNAMIDLTISTNGYDNAAEGINVSPFLIYSSYAQTIDTITWNNQPTASQYNSTKAHIYSITNTPAAGSNVSMNITNIVQSAKSLGYSFTFIKVNTTTHIGAVHNNDYVYYYADNNPAYAPRAIIDYDIPADNTPPYVTISPVNITTTNISLAWNITFNELSNVSNGTYGTCPDHTNNGSYFNSTFATYFEFNFSGLNNGTSYCFNLTEFCDESDNCNTTGYNFSFTTTLNPTIIIPPIPEPIKDSVSLYLNLSNRTKSRAYNLDWKAWFDYGYDEANMWGCYKEYCYNNPQINVRTLIVFNLTTGEQIWNSSPINIGNYGVAYYNGSIYAVMSNNAESNITGALYQYNITNGELLCMLNESNIINSMGGVIINELDNVGFFVNGFWVTSPPFYDELIMFNLSNCSHILHRENISATNTISDRLTATLSMGNNRIFLNPTYGTKLLQMYNATTGIKIENITLNASYPNNGGSWDNAPTNIEEDMSLLIGTDTGFYRINYTNGTMSRIWGNEVGYQANWKSVHMIKWDDYVLGVEGDTSYGRFNVFNYTTGTLIWYYPINTRYVHSQTPVTTEDGTFYIMADSPQEKMMQFNFSTGEVLWEFIFTDHETNNVSAGGAIMTNGKLSTKSPNGYHYTFDIGNGTGNWTTLGGNMARTGRCSDCLTSQEYLDVNCTEDVSGNYTCTLTNMYSANITGINFTVATNYTWYNDSWNIIKNSSKFMDIDKLLEPSESYNIHLLYYNVSNCPYTVIDCTTTHLISDNCDNEMNNILFTGAGNLMLTANITNVGNVTIYDCNVICTSGCFK